MRENGCRVLFLACFKNPDDRFRAHLIEDSADQVIFCYDDPIDAIMNYNQKNKDMDQIHIKDVTQIYVQGSTLFTKSIAEALKTSLAHLFQKNPNATGCINAPMQCMMKGICAQCLQVHKNQETGLSQIIYSCITQNQTLSTVDFKNLRGRLQQNALLEKINSLWVTI
jgi:NAD(P)H-flavin reductase